MQPRAQLDSVLRRAVDAVEVPGVVAMATTDKGLLYEGAFGTRDLGKGPAMTLDTVFRIASMTKAVTCVAAKRITGVILTQILPFADPRGTALRAVRARRLRCVERGVSDRIALLGLPETAGKPLA